MKTPPRLPAYARGRGRPRLDSPSARLVLTMPRAEYHELRAAAGARQITGFLLDCVRVAMRTRPSPSIRTSYHVQRIATDTPMWMEVAVDRWPDGRIITRYTGTQYPDEASARDACARLNEKDP